MQACDPDIVQTVDLVAHDFGAHDGFFGDRKVGCASGNDQDNPASQGCGGTARDYPGVIVEYGPG